MRIEHGTLLAASKFIQNHLLPEIIKIKKFTLIQEIQMVLCWHDYTASSCKVYHRNRNLVSADESVLGVYPKEITALSMINQPESIFLQCI